MANDEHQPDDEREDDDGDGHEVDPVPFTPHLNGHGSHDAGEPVDADLHGDVYAALSLKQQRTIIALINEPTLAKAAEAADVGIRTIYHWLDTDRFARAYRRARRESFAQAIGLSQRYAALAVNTLAQVMASQAVGASARVSAAATLLKFSRESIELDDLAARVESLEQAQDGGHRSSWRAAG